jgi:DNA-binding CsgD family transcriptional regulator
VTGVYEAALEPARWELLLPRLLKALGCQRGLIGFAVDDRPGVEVGVSVGIDPEVLFRWETEFERFDPFYESLGGRIPRVGSAFRIYDVVEPESVRSTEVFRAIYEPMGTDNHLLTITSHAGERGSYFAAYRGLDEPDFTIDECKLHALLSPHLVLAAQMHDRLSALTCAVEAQEVASELLPFGLFWLDEIGRISAMNGAAKRVLAQRELLVTRGAVLRAASQAVQPDFERAIAVATAVANGRSEGGATLLRFGRVGFGSPCTVLVAPIPRHSREGGFGYERAKVLVVVSDPEARPRLSLEALRKLFGLTPALAQLALAITSGKTLKEHAAEAGITIGTARQHLKELFARTNTCRQAELVRVILTSVAGIA